MKYFFEQNKFILAITFSHMMKCNILRSKLPRNQIWSGMQATAELPSRAKKAKSDIVFSCICSNEFKILVSFYLILQHIEG